jgi:hypothetical protein
MRRVLTLKKFNGVRQHVEDGLEALNRTLGGTG